MPMRNTLGMAVLALMLALGAGCDSAGDDAASSSGVGGGGARKALSPEAARLAGSMVRAVGAGGGKASVDVKFELTQRPAVGKPVDISLALIPTSPLERLYARFQASDGLELVKGDHTEQITRPVIGDPITHTLTVIPRHDGIFSVMAIVLTDSQSESVSRNYTIPLIAGTGLPESAPRSAGAGAIPIPHANSSKNPTGR